MSVAVFPGGRGLAWDVKKKSAWTTLKQDSATPGFGTRVQQGQDPIFHFECDFEFLAEARYGSAFNELDRIEGFFNSMGGDYESFLLSLPMLTGNAAHGAIVGQVLTVDANGVAPLIVTKDPTGSDYDEAIYEAAGVNGNSGSPPVIKLDGVALTSGTDYTIAGPGYAASGVSYGGLVVEFTADTTGKTVTADFSWYYRVMFEQSEQEFDLFSSLLWEAKQVQMVVTRV